jgi:hypothetical protein
MAEVTGQYYAGEGEIGYGTELLVGQDDGSPETFVALSNVVEVNLGGFTAPTIDISHLRSPGRAREKTTGLRDYQDITVRCNYVLHGSHLNAGGDGFTNGGMRAIHISQEERNFMAVRHLGDEVLESIPFRGKVSGITQPVLNNDNKMEVTYTITPMRDYLASLG